MKDLKENNKLNSGDIAINLTKAEWEQEKEYCFFSFFFFFKAKQPQQADLENSQTRPEALRGTGIW